MTALLLQRLSCCLTGHDYSVKADGTRMFLRCKVCGHTSRGLVMAEDPCHRQRRLGRTASSGNRSPAGRAPVSAR